MTERRDPLEPVSDETLTAYLDDALDPAERVAIDARLETDDELAGRLETLDRGGAGLAAAFDLALETARAETARLQIDALRSPPRGRVWPLQRAAAAWLVAALGLGAAAGFGVGVDMSEPTPRGWRAAAADYVALYTPDSLSAAPDASSQAALAQIAERFDLAIDGDMLARVGLTFREARILMFQGAAIGQIMTLDPDLGVVALCVITSKAADRERVVDRLGGLAAVHWIDEARGLLLIGGDDLDAIAAVAERIQPLLRRS